MATATAPGGLGRFSALTRGWFEGAFAAFLSAIARLAGAPPVPGGERLRVLYIPPLKALAADIERNLRAPLAGLRAAAAGQDLPLPDITVGMRTGDTPADARRRFQSHPPDILITTPESLFLLLTSRAREALAHVDTVIVDEVHSVVAPPSEKDFDLSVVVPVEDMAAIGDPADDPASGSAAGAPERSSIWPHI